MTIKEELTENYQKAIKRENERKEQNLQIDAIEFIEQFIIPEFRKIHQKKPTSNFVSIAFHQSECEDLYYRTNLDICNDGTKSTYSIDVVEKAVELAKDFDINAFKDEKFKAFVFRLYLNS